jgi:hypothetical protein
MASQDFNVGFVIFLKKEFAFVAWVFFGGIGVDHSGNHRDVVSLGSPNLGHLVKPGAARILFFKEILVYK